MTADPQSMVEIPFLAILQANLTPPPPEIFLHNFFLCNFAI